MRITVFLQRDACVRGSSKTAGNVIFREFKFQNLHRDVLESLPPVKWHMHHIAAYTSFKMPPTPNSIGKPAPVYKERGNRFGFLQIFSFSMTYRLSLSSICDIFQQYFKRPQLFNNFIPSLLKTLFIQKKMSAFIVEFIVITVDTQKKTHIAIFDLTSNMFNKVSP